jgi:hypothetical protein
MPSYNTTGLHLIQLVVFTLLISVEMSRMSQIRSQQLVSLRNDSLERQSPYIQHVSDPISW